MSGLYEAGMRCRLLIPPLVPRRLLCVMQPSGELCTEYRTSFQQCCSLQHARILRPCNSNYCLASGTATRLHYDYASRDTSSFTPSSRMTCGRTQQRLPRGVSHARRDVLLDCRDSEAPPSQSLRRMRKWGIEHRMSNIGNRTLDLCLSRERARRRRRRRRRYEDTKSKTDAACGI